jgi:hypothetical protein
MTFKSLVAKLLPSRRSHHTRILLDLPHSEKIAEVKTLLEKERKYGRRSDTGKEIRHSKYRDGSYRMIYGVWVDSRLEYETLGIPLGIAPPNRPDAVDNSPGVPESVLGSCGRCKVSWKWVEGHLTLYSCGSACFPLCEKCWSDLTPEERVPYYRELFDKWRSDAIRFNSDSSTYSDVLWQQILTAVLTEK